MTRFISFISYALMLGVAFAPADVFAQRRGGGRGNEGGGRGNSGSAPRVEPGPRVQQPQPRVQQPQPRVQQPTVPSVRVPDVRVPSARVPDVRGDVRGGAAGGVRVDGSGARIRTDGSATGNARIGDARARSGATFDSRAGFSLPGNLNRTANQSIYRNNINIGQRSLAIAPTTYRASAQYYPWHRGYWNSYYGWNPQIGWGNGYYGNWGGYGIRLGNVFIGTGGYGGYGPFGGYGYGQYPIGWGYGGWGLGSLLYGSGYMPYFNPYWGGGFGGPGYVYDYARPVYVSTSAAPSDVAMSDFDAAREAFRAADYETAFALVNRAIKENPSDGVLHEFRALTQFALRDYRGAAATIHSVLAVGPGWDWATMAALYGDPGDYTTQLRALESFTKEHPSEAAPQFLLGYHYMTTGHPEAAAKEFASVVKLQPKDRVAREMLNLVDTPKESDLAAAPAPRADGNRRDSARDVDRGELPPAEPARRERADDVPPARPDEQPKESVRPIDPQSIAGHWQSSREDGSKFALDLKPDKTFTWKFNQGKHEEDFSGTYSTEGSLLVLQKREGGAMVGHVDQKGDDRFAFRVLGAPEDDPGLTFSR